MSTLRTILKPVKTSLDSYGEFVARAVVSNGMRLITFVTSAVQPTTSPIHCKGSDKAIAPGTIIHVEAPGPYNEGQCEVCHAVVPARYARIPAYTGPRGIMYVESGQWVTLPHNKPFTSHCADCGAGFYEADYLCPKCRASMTA